MYERCNKIVTFDTQRLSYWKCINWKSRVLIFSWFVLFYFVFHYNIKINRIDGILLSEKDYILLILNEMLGPNHVHLDVMNKKWLIEKKNKNKHIYTTSEVHSPHTLLPCLRDIDIHFYGLYLKHCSNFAQKELEIDCRDVKVQMWRRRK